MASPFAALAARSASASAPDTTAPVAGRSDSEPAAPPATKAAGVIGGMRHLLRRGAYATTSHAKSASGSVRIGHLDDPVDPDAPQAIVESAPVRDEARDAPKVVEAGNPSSIYSNEATRERAHRVYEPTQSRSTTPSPFAALIDKGSQPEVRKARADMHALNMLTVLASAVLYRPNGTSVEDKTGLLNALLRDARVMSRSFLAAAKLPGEATPKWLIAESLSLAAEVVAENWRHALVGFAEDDQFDLLNSILDDEAVRSISEEISHRTYVEATDDEIAAARIRITMATCSGRVVAAVRSARTQAGSAVRFEGVEERRVVAELLDIIWSTAKKAPVFIENRDTATAYFQSALKRATELLYSDYERVARQHDTLAGCVADLRESVETHFLFIEQQVAEIFERDKNGENQQVPHERG